MGIKIGSNPNNTTKARQELMNSIMDNPGPSLVLTWDKAIARDKEAKNAPRTRFTPWSVVRQWLASGTIPIR